MIQYLIDLLQILNEIRVTQKILTIQKIFSYKCKIFDHSIFLEIIFLLKKDSELPWLYLNQEVIRKSISFIGPH